MATIALPVSGQIGKLRRRGGAQQKLARLPLTSGVERGDELDRTTGQERNRQAVAKQQAIPG